MRRTRGKMRISLPKVALDDGGVLSGHLSCEVGLVVVHKVGVRDDDQRGLNLKGVSNSASSWRKNKCLLSAMVFSIAPGGGVCLGDARLQ